MSENSLLNVLLYHDFLLCILWCMLFECRLKFHDELFSLGFDFHMSESVDLGFNILFPHLLSPASNFDPNSIETSWFHLKYMRVS